MNALDWVVIAILVYTVVISAMRGFVREILSLASILVALVVAGWFYRSATPLVKDVVKTENVALFFGFSIVFVGTLLAAFLVVRIITKFVKFAKVEWFDRCLGVAFGLIRGWVLAAIVVLGLTAFEVQTDRGRSSEMARFFLPGSRVVALVTPYEVKARFLVGYRAVEQWWREQL